MKIPFLLCKAFLAATAQAKAASVLHLVSSSISRTLSLSIALRRSHTPLLHGLSADVHITSILKFYPILLKSLLLNSPPLSVKIFLGDSNRATQYLSTPSMVTSGNLLLITQALQYVVAKSIITRKYFSFQTFKSILTTSSKFLARGMLTIGLLKAFLHLM